MPHDEAVDLANLTPLDQLRAGRLPRRLLQLLIGLGLYGTSMAMMVRGNLGLDPWDVFHYGVAAHLPITFGQTVILAGVGVLLLWVPLRQMPGVGTVANALLIGLVADAVLGVLHTPSTLVGQLALLVGGVVMNGLATAVYLGSQLGPGPRDGLMTGLVRTTGWSLRVIRTGIEVTVVAIGWSLGGILGLGTVLYALSIGPLVQWMLPWFTVSVQPPAVPDTAVSQYDG